MFHKKNNDQRRYTYLILAMESSYFEKNPTDSTKKFSETLEFLIDNIFAMFGGRLYQQTIGTPMGANSAPLLDVLFRYSSVANFIQGLLKKNDEKKLGRSFNFSHMDDILPLNNCNFGDFVDRIFPIELEIKRTRHI